MNLNDAYNITRGIRETHHVRLIDYGEIVFVVHYEYEPPEPDVGFDGNIVINRVELNGKDLYGLLTDEVIEFLREKAMDKHYG